MAGHSKWHNIKHKKAASDAKKWKIFSVHAKLIALAAQNGADPEDNPHLLEAITKAKAENVPNANIDRAIKRWAWLDKDSVQYSEITYEWFGASWVWIVIKTITDNKNRSASEVRHAFTKFGWNLWESWSLTNFLFEMKWEIIIDIDWLDKDDIEETLLETNAEDYEFKEWILRVITSRDDFSSVKKDLLDKELKIIKDWLEYIPNNEVEISDEIAWLKIVQLLNALEELDDVSNIWSNENISEEMLESVNKKIEASIFRT